MGLIVIDKAGPKFITKPWWRPFKANGGNEVEYVDLAPHPGHEATAWEWLSEDERRRWRVFEYPGPRRRFALCRAALRAMLCKRMRCDNGDLAFELMERGKPRALLAGVPAPVNFNVSHSGGHGLIAINPSGRVGVDVEERREREDLAGLIEIAMGPQERTELSSLPEERRLHTFYDLWTAKEALVKALGSGHHIDFSQFDAPGGMRRGEPEGDFRFQHLPKLTWRVQNIGNEDFAAALAVEVKPV